MTAASRARISWSCFRIRRGASPATDRPAVVHVNEGDSLARIRSRRNREVG
ncbi:hypothetical protein C882_2836 [Caenispirillum salinarum AK4]|uniref:Uncharacterized protein n=1 Tax=Caenispirillum salinarum AK4 TaxID=1238182 RepID=K9H6M1_9PROT|nr:hypothetical protein C882_2836 [Caenispirillum salinarum AK4]